MRYDAYFGLQPKRALSREVRELFAHDHMVANRVVAIAVDSDRNVYSLWTDGRCTRIDAFDEHKRTRQAEVPRPFGLEWVIQEREPGTRAYVYVLLIGEKFRPPRV